MADHSRLGRGLASLMGDVGEEAAKVEQERNPRRAPIENLKPNPRNPRRTFSDAELGELTASIRERGIIQPIVVRKVPGDADAYEIIAGERRWRAAQAVGLQRIPALVRSVDDPAALVQTLVENLQREDLNPVETARGIARLIEEFDLTHEDAARRLGRSREAVSHLLRILRLEPAVLAAVAERRLSVGHAKLLVGLPQPMQRHLAAEVAQKDLSVRALERRIRSLNDGRTQQTADDARRDPDIVRLEQRVGEIVGAETRIDYESGKDRGQIAFTFYSLEALDGILERLGYQAGS